MNMLNIQQHVQTRTLIMSSSSNLSAMVQDLRQATTSGVLVIPSNPSDVSDGHGDSCVTGGSPNIQPHHVQTMRVRTRRLMSLQSRLFGKAPEFFVQQACGAWIYGLRTYNIRPYGSPVFEHAMDGRIVALQQL